MVVITYRGNATYVCYRQVREMLWPKQNFPTKWSMQKQFWPRDSIRETGKLNSELSWSWHCLCHTGSCRLAPRSPSTYLNHNHIINPIILTCRLFMMRTGSNTSKHDHGDPKWWANVSLLIHPSQ